MRLPCPAGQAVTSWSPLALSHHVQRLLPGAAPHGRGWRLRGGCPPAAAHGRARSCRSRLLDWAARWSRGSGLAGAAGLLARFLSRGLAGMSARCLRSQVWLGLAVGAGPCRAATSACARCSWQGPLQAAKRPTWPPSCSLPRCCCRCLWRLALTARWRGLRGASLLTPFMQQCAWRAGTAPIAAAGFRRAADVASLAPQVPPWRACRAEVEGCPAPVEKGHA